jgi:hypothetical protein
VSRPELHTLLLEHWLSASRQSRKGLVAAPGLIRPELAADQIERRGDC